VHRYASRCSVQLYIAIILDCQSNLLCLKGTTDIVTWTTVLGIQLNQVVMYDGWVPAWERYSAIWCNFNVFAVCCLKATLAYITLHTVQRMSITSTTWVNLTDRREMWKYIPVTIWITVLHWHLTVLFLNDAERLLAPVMTSTGVEGCSTLWVAVAINWIVVVHGTTSAVVDALTQCQPHVEVHKLKGTPAQNFTSYVLGPITKIRLFEDFCNILSEKYECI